MLGISVLGKKERAKLKYHGTVYLALNLLVYAAIGIGALSTPEGFAAGIDLGLLKPAAVPEFLATFGGLMLAIAAGLGIALAMPRYRAQAYLLLALAYVGFGGGRLFGMLVHSGFDWRNGIFLLLEVLLCVWGLFCWRDLRKQGVGS